MPYTQFWHHYVAQHAAHHGTSHSIDPGAALMTVICATLLVAWALSQSGGRCQDCHRWPVRCSCRPAEHR